MILHPDFNYNIEFRIEGLGYDDSIMHHIPMKINFRFHQTKALFVGSITCSRPNDWAYYRVFFQRKNSWNLEPWHIHQWYRCKRKEHYDKKSAAHNIGYRCFYSSFLSSMIVSDIEKKKNTQ